jgi:hypothetical protein
VGSKEVTRQLQQEGRKRKQVGCRLSAVWNCEIEDWCGVVLAGVLCVSGRGMTAHELETWKRADGAIECHAMPYNLKKVSGF